MVPIALLALISYFFCKWPDIVKRKPKSLLRMDFTTVSSATVFKFSVKLFKDFCCKISLSPWKNNVLCLKTKLDINFFLQKKLLNSYSWNGLNRVIFVIICNPISPKNFYRAILTLQTVAKLFFRLSERNFVRNFST